MIKEIYAPRLFPNLFALISGQDPEETSKQTLPHVSQFCTRVRSNHRKKAQSKTALRFCFNVNKLLNLTLTNYLTE